MAPVDSLENGKADSCGWFLGSNGKRPPGNRAAFFFQGRIVLTEGKVRQNFLAKSYEPKKGGVKGFFDNKCLSFQLFTKSGNIAQNCSILRQRHLEDRLKRIN
jgi:hypothetical protein